MPEADIVRAQAGKLARSQAQVDDLVMALKSGAYLSAAAEYAGLNRDTVNTWVRRGRKLNKHLDENPDFEPNRYEQQYIELATVVDKAIAGVQVTATVSITRAIQAGDWRAAAWLLEHRFKDDWADRKEITGANGLPIEVDISQQRQMATEALNQLAKRLDAIEGGGDVVDAELVEETAQSAPPELTGRSVEHVANRTG